MKLEKYLNEIAFVQRLKNAVTQIPGKEAIDAKGNPISNSISLSETTVAIKKGSTLRIVDMCEWEEQTVILELDNKETSILKRFI